MAQDSYAYRVSTRKDGSVVNELFYKNNEYHREGDLPAVIHYFADGSIVNKLFYKNNLCHREGDLPAEIHYRKDSSVESERFYKDGQEYTPNKPAPYAGKLVEIDGKKFKLVEVS
jgi:antitoxin component YwqK of YwqJK toxin-antitoxin module